MRGPPQMDCGGAVVEHEMLGPQSPTFALVLSLCQPAPAGTGAAPYARQVVEAIQPSSFSTRLVVLGSDGGLMAETFGNGWNFLVNRNWQHGPVAGLRQAMRALPLMDGFYLACSGRGRLLGLDSEGNGRKPLRQAMADAYLAGRTKLMRIVVPVVDGDDCWPWLVDIGFRQPFVELTDDGAPEAVIQANAAQVIRLDATAWAGGGKAA